MDGQRNNRRMNEHSLSTLNLFTILFYNLYLGIGNLMSMEFIYLVYNPLFSSLEKIKFSSYTDYLKFHLSVLSPSPYSGCGEFFQSTRVFHYL